MSFEFSSMLVNFVKKFTDKLVPSKLLEFLIKIKLTPNQITFLAFIFGLVAFYFFVKGKVFLGALACILNHIFDGLDGRFARYLKKITKTGALFDLISDRFIRLSWILALAFGGIVTFKLALVVLFLESISYIITYFIEHQNLKHIQWMPNVIYLLPYGALLNQLPLFFTIEIVLGSLALMVNIVSVAWLNREFIKTQEHKNARTR